MTIVKHFPSFSCEPNRGRLKTMLLSQKIRTLCAVRVKGFSEDVMGFCSRRLKRDSYAYCDGCSLDGKGIE